MNIVVMKNLDLLTDEEAKEFMDSIDTIIMDINGVLWDNTFIPGVQEALLQMKRANKSLRFVTNNNFHSFDYYEKRFNSLGIELREEDLIFPAITLVNYLRSINFDKKIFCITSSFTMGYLKKAGINCVAEDPNPVTNSSEFFQRISDDAEVAAVFVDTDIAINYTKISKVIEILKRPEVLYLIGAIDKEYVISAEKCIMGTGVFQDIISEQTQRKPIILGKPSEYLKNFMFERFNINHPNRKLFIGDTFDQDMALSVICGFQKLLVFSGIASYKGLQQYSCSDLKPDYYADSIASMISVIEKCLKN